MAPLRLALVLLAIVVLAPDAAHACKKNPDCQDGNPCTSDKCDKATKTCVLSPVNTGPAGSAGKACTQNDSCQAGVCVGAAVTCSAADQCHAAGTCDPATGQCTNPTVPDDTPCTDYNHCTQADLCEGGVCIGG